jgi:hypothetical protein
MAAFMSVAYFAWIYQQELEERLLGWKSFGIGCITKMGSLSFESSGDCLVGGALPCPVRLASELAGFIAN